MKSANFLYGLGTSWFSFKGEFYGYFLLMVSMNNIEIIRFITKSMTQSITLYILIFRIRLISSGVEKQMFCYYVLCYQGKMIENSLSGYSFVDTK
jgi:hypothetical protein